SIHPCSRLRGCSRIRLAKTLSRLPRKAVYAMRPCSGSDDDKPYLAIPVSGIATNHITSLHANTKDAFVTRINPNHPRFSGLARLSRAAMAFAAVVLIAGCGTAKVETDPTTGWSAERLYQDARAEISAGNW